MAIMSVKLGGIKFKLPFIDLIPYDGRDQEDLGADIKESGVVKVPVICWKEKSKKGEEETVVDGAHRIVEAAAAGLDKVPIQYRPYASEEDARKDCERLNYARRHLTPQQMAERRGERIEMVAAMRAEGKSTREIADAVDVSQPTVLKDIKAAGDKGLSAEPPEGKIVGKDKKKHAATKTEKNGAEVFDWFRAESRFEALARDLDTLLRLHPKKKAEIGKMRGLLNTSLKTFAKIKKDATAAKK